MLMLVCVDSFFDCLSLLLFFQDGGIIDSLFSKLSISSDLSFVLTYVWQH